MFASTLTKVSKFSKPLIISTRMLDGSTNSGTGTFVMINDEGWALTAGHNLQAWAKTEQDRPLVAEYDAEIERISELDAGKRKSARKKLNRRIDPTRTVRNCSYWWGDDQICSLQAHGSEPEIDLAAVKLDQLPVGFCDEYPTWQRSLGSGTDQVHQLRRPSPGRPSHLTGA